MDKVFLVAVREYLTSVRRPAFLFAAFGTPLIIIVAFALISLSAGGDGIRTLEEFGKIGYVDNSPTKVLAAGAVPEDEAGLWVAYPNLEVARAALDNGEIAAYIELPAAYMLTGRVNAYLYGDTPDIFNRAVNEFVLMNLTAGTDLPVALDRIRGSLDMLVQNSETGREVTEDGMFATLFLPVIFAFVLMLSAFTTSGFLMQGLVEERTSRIIEILVTSITPMQLLLGKIIGLGLLGLTQVLALLIAAVAILQIGSGSLEFLQGISIPLDLAVMAIIYYLLGYFLMAAILATVGVLTNSEQESRQISSFIMMPFILPYILIFFFITDPNGTVPTILSLVPVTAPMAVLMRFGLTEVPTWQIILSMVLMLITIVIVVWLSARVFRWGLLLYGKKFNLREIWRVITSRQVSMGTTAAHSTQEGAI